MIYYSSLTRNASLEREYRMFDSRGSSRRVQRECDVTLERYCILIDTDTLEDTLDNISITTAQCHP